ncbi:hypothetical protein SAMN02745121_06149 [Nannocystis exedens]|uniref:NIPSNAP protein n=2 Tax=Nannocystis exedens TaxID=54 RepID=A0A1I2ELY2_9BACT|nr:hypothetical protein NAEX_07020 [Nannocystis exedens]SFE94084.1 hypothetical protein SAMN02745121_06149 [Nannocystis exedens]
MAFAAALRGSRRAEAEAAYRRYGVLLDTWHIQHTPFGPWVLVVTRVDDCADIEAYAASSDEFEVWFKSTVHALTGSDPNKAPLRPPSTELYTWTGVTRVGSEAAE